ncbi:MAG TPA: hypothetical protein VF473_10325 [Cyclobacteriaceae bacterium]
MLTVLSIVTYAQTAVEKTFPVAGAKELVVNFDHPNVTLQTWDKNEVAIKGTVSINNGENDANFELQTSNINGVLSITSLLKDKENIPRHVVIHRADDQEFVFKAKSIDDPEVQKFLEEKGRDYSWISNTLLMKIELQVFVRKNLKTTVDIKYGLVEFKTFDAPLKVVAKYSKVDATVPPTIGGITARTKHGEILTNLDFKFDKAPFERDRNNNWTEISAHPGKGQDYFIESTYGTVYLRKP